MSIKSLRDDFYNNIMPKIYGLGASVVIIGAMFKLNGFPYATLLLVIGLSTEAIIFAFSAFEPNPKDLAAIMERRLPVLGSDQKDSIDFQKMLKQAIITPEGLNKLGEGMNNLAENAQKMSELSGAVTASKTYAENAMKASETLAGMNQSYVKTADALGEMTLAAKEGSESHKQLNASMTEHQEQLKASMTEHQDQLKTSIAQYQDQLKHASVQLGALNNVYKEELNDSQAHLKAIKLFYANIDTALAGVGAATKEAEEFKAAMAQLNQNVSSLNKVYGAMLSAMKSN